MESASATRIANPIANPVTMAGAPATVTLPRLMTTEDLAEYLHMRPDSVAAMRRAGKGPKYVKHGGKIWYLASDVLVWIISHRVDPRDRLRPACGGAAEEDELVEDEFDESEEMMEGTSPAMA